MSAVDLLRIYREAIAAVEPRAAVLRALALDGGMLRAGEFSCDLADVERIVVVGAGKAAAGMAAAVEEILGGRIESGLVVVKDGHTGPPGRIAQVEAAHPLPDERGARAAARILELVGGADAKTLVICLLSGGASALLVAPAPGITLEDKIRTTDLLLASGADIAEVNTVRKHLSAVKGGRLAAQARPARLLTLALSDVIGDRLDVIGSGPTFPDGSTFSDAREALGRRGLLSRLPPAVRIHLERGALCDHPGDAQARGSAVRRGRALHRRQQSHRPGCGRRERARPGVRRRSCSRPRCRAMSARPPAGWRERSGGWRRASPRARVPSACSAAGRPR